MNKELAKVLTTAIVQFIDRERSKETMCCSNMECIALEAALVDNDFKSVEDFIQYKLSGLTEFEEGLIEFYNERNCIPCDKDGVYNKHELDNFLHTWSSKLLAIAKKELLKNGELD